MASTVADDPWGTRWTVPPCRLGDLTYADPADPHRTSLPVLRHWLAGMLAPHPMPGCAPPSWGSGGPGHDPSLGVMADALSATSGVGPSELVRLVRALGPAVRFLATPRPAAGLPCVALVARGRIRRWGIWQLTGEEEEAASVVAAVATDVRDGRVPDPRGAVLVDVVDQRPLRFAVSSPACGPSASGPPPR